MKIGIITLSGGENYGCHLQTFAVIKTYEALGYEAKLIPDMTTRGIKSTYQKRSTLSKLSPSYVLSVVKTRENRKYYIKNQRDKLIPSIIRKKLNSSAYAKSRKQRTENAQNQLGCAFPKTYIGFAVIFPHNLFHVSSSTVFNCFVFVGKLVFLED